jgi:hypothetical protein
LAGRSLLPHLRGATALCRLAAPRYRDDLLELREGHLATTFHFSERATAMTSSG